MHRSRIAFLALASVALVAILAAQVVALRLATPELSATEFREAFFLRSSHAWHYGYVRGHHGAQLVRTARTDAPLLAPAHSDATLTPIMTSALSSLPRKAALEGLFYFFVAVVALLGIRWLIRLRPSGLLRRLAVVLLFGTFAVLVLFAFLTPYLAAGYGASAFSTWVGPGACSSSGGHLWLFTAPGETVSYRYAVELALYSSLWFARQGSGYPLHDDLPMPVLVVLELLPSRLHPTRLPFFADFLSAAAAQAFTLGVALFGLSAIRRRA